MKYYIFPELQIQQSNGCFLFMMCRIVDISHFVSVFFPTCRQFSLGGYFYSFARQGVGQADAGGG